MRPVGFFRASAIVAAKDLRLEWKTFESLASTVVFSLIVLVVFSFAFGVGSAAEFGAERLVPGMLWTILAFGAVVGMTRSMQLERRRDTLGALFLAPIDRGALYMGKMTANLFKLTLLQWVLVPLTAVFFDYSLAGRVWILLGVLFIHGVGLTELGTLFAGITTRIGRGEAFLATLLFPAATPLLISAVKCTAACLNDQPMSEVTNWLMLAIGFDVLYLFVALLTFEFVLEE
jgi:heme exporter protein B